MSFEAEVEIIGEGGVPLADWWRVGTGACHSGGLQVLSPPGTGTCDVSGLGAGTVGIEYPTPPAANYERVRLLGVFDATPVALVAGTEYEFFRLRINHTKSVGAGSCVGCSAPVMLILKSMRLMQGACTDPALANAVSRAAQVESHIADVIVTEPG